MATNPACFTLEHEEINLKTGARRWVQISPIPKGACPSCCDKKGKLLKRTVLERDTCTVPFADETGRTWRKRIELKYADGDCGTYSVYQYDLPCTDPMKKLFLNRVAFFGQCRASVRFESTKGGIYEFSAPNTSQEINLPFGTLKVSVMVTECGGDIQLRSLNSSGQPGSVIHISRQAPATIVITDLTYGFYIDNL